eukprot:UN02719
MHLVQAFQQSVPEYDMHDQLVDFCTVCNTSDLYTEGDLNELLICDCCQRPYHRNFCLELHEYGSTSEPDEDDTFICDLCLGLTNMLNWKSEIAFKLDTIHSQLLALSKLASSGTIQSSQ